MASAETPITKIAMLIYPVFTTLDAIGPHQVLAGLPNTKVDLIARDRSPVLSDRKVSLNPDKSFEECEADYDVLLIPGGMATHQTMEDEETIKFVGRIGKNAKYVTAICTGSMILATAGLLDGYRANSHWAFRHLLPPLGAILAEGRVVVDRNRITGGGVTAGIDFGLKLASILKGDNVGKLMELVLEYDPEPPFKTGTPDRADEETLKNAKTRIAPMVDSMKAAVERIAVRRKEAAA